MRNGLLLERADILSVDNESSYKFEGMNMYLGKEECPKPS